LAFAALDLGLTKADDGPIELAFGGCHVAQQRLETFSEGVAHEEFEKAVRHCREQGVRSSSRNYGTYHRCHGAVIANASVTVTNVGAEAEHAVASSSDGYYTVPLLLPGEYTIGVQRAGFKPVLRSGVVLAVDQRAELDPYVRRR
jgi:hypothetical protein